MVVLRGLFSDGRVDQNTFQEALDALFAVHSEVEFASLMRSLPPPGRCHPARSPAARAARDRDVDGRSPPYGRWQVGRLTKIDTGMGAVIVDLTEAEFDDLDVQIVVHTRMGAITVISPLASISDSSVRTVRSP